MTAPPNYPAFGSRTYVASDFAPNPAPPEPEYRSPLWVRVLDWFDKNVNGGRFR